MLPIPLYCKKNNYTLHCNSCMYVVFHESELLFSTHTHVLVCVFRAVWMVTVTQNDLHPRVEGWKKGRENIRLLR